MNIFDLDKWFWITLGIEVLVAVVMVLTFYIIAKIKQSK